MSDFSHDMISAYQSSTSPNDLHALISTIDASISSIDSSLNQYIKEKSKSHQQEQEHVELARTTRLIDAIRASQNLTSLFNGATDLGRALTYKIKLLDEEIGNVNATLEYVQQIQTLKANIDRASYATSHGNWEDAANALSVISGIPSNVVEGKFAQVVIPTAEIPDPPATVIAGFRETLTREFQKGFNEAVKERNVEKITTYFKLFPLIGEHETGLACYARFISGIVGETCGGLLKSVVNEPKSGVFGRIMIGVFESVGEMLIGHGRLIKEHYNQDSDTSHGLHSVIALLQSEIDSQTGMIIDTFYDTRRVDKLLQDIHHYEFPRLANEEAEEDDSISIVHAGDVLSEVCTMIQQWSFYKAFLTRRYYDEAPEFFSTCRLQKNVSTRLIPTFQTLYTFYIRRSVEKAISIEQVGSLENLLQKDATPEETVCTSVVEDTTLILNATLKHVISTGMASMVRQFVSEAFKVISNDVISFLVRRLAQNSPRYNYGLQIIQEREKNQETFFGAVVSDNMNNASYLLFITYLNSVGTISEYVEKIVDNASKALEGVYRNEKEVKIVATTLADDLVKPLTTSCNRIISDNLITLYNQSLKSRTFSAVAEFLPEKQEHFHTAYGEHDDVVLRFCRTWQSLVVPYKRTMHPGIYEKIQRLVVVNLVNILENRMLMLMRRFGVSESGAVKLERDLSGLISETCGDDYSLREKFVRVTQIVLLVGLDDEEYAESTKHANQAVEGEFLGINWVLTPQERETVRAYRR